ncbi:Predicted ATP-binding protein involved in virulence [Prosthecobacter debontii]|uniref:Predicted ATP-binding protein involved in virulence n=1 Tax=Prosthecobacter debontii TaxID=48467 RepID=A0A1T4Z2Z2_9BACT|nr:AAA family ATPase [Prosthecobacter debontii]SKB07921.1 Predicted ATP-binding protein involved in virulence [Prosthecobacter debontii]
MILQNIHLTQFRCFPSLDLALNDRLNVFIGGNGSGKSALLDAIALSLAPILSHLPDLSGPGIKKASDLRLIGEDRQAPYCQIKATAALRDGRVQMCWDRLAKRDNAKSTRAALPKDAGSLRLLHEWLDEIIDQHAKVEPFTLPVFAHYGTNRAVDVPHNKPSAKRRKSFARLDALRDALNPDADFRRTVAWFKTLEDQELRQKDPSRPSLLEPVRRAIERMLPDIQHPRMDEDDTQRFVVDGHNSDGKPVKLFLDQLSDGYQVMLGVVMDFALRLVLANPVTEAQPDPLAAEAIMIVDEVDLHLHPEWQQRVIPDLMRTFTGTQFIFTTHSPQVVSTVRKKFVRKLAEYNIHELPTETIGAESSRVLEDAFNVPIRPENLKEVKLLNDYIHLAETPDADPLEIAKQRAVVRDIFSDDEPAIELTDMALEQRRILEELNLQMPVIPAPVDDEEDFSDEEENSEEER